MTDPVKAKIIQLVPEIKLPNDYTECCGTCGKPNIAPLKHCLDYLHECHHRFRPITLADVLRAIGGTYYRDDYYSFSGSWLNELVKKWNLTTDFDGQTQEVKEFLGQLLGVTGNTVT